MFSVGIQRGPSYLLATATGPADVHENCSGILFVTDLLRRTGTRKLLFDMMALEPSYGPEGAIEVISTLYSSMPEMEKIAVLVPAGMSKGIILEVARHRGVTAREFADVRAADEWLRGEA